MSEASYPNDLIPIPPVLCVSQLPETAPDGAGCFVHSTGMIYVYNADGWKPYWRPYENHCPW